uniref:zinc finger protein 862-like n=1 Tax=Pristiophorus japonicus TaxID=55135 RepID=UPI00398F731B
MVISPAAGSPMIRFNELNNEEESCRLQEDINVLVSDYIKVQPVDIQPDIFSYLLHLMYTGKGPKQPVDPNRLEEGIRFLHAYNLVHDPGHTGQVFVQHHEVLPLQSPNLYGIQISGSQKLAMRDLQPSGGRAVSGTGSSMPGSEALCQVSLGVPSNNPEHRYARAPVAPAASQEAGAGPEDYSPSLSTGSRAGGSSSGPLLVPGLNFKRGKYHKLYSCHYCGERFNVRSSLRDHLYSHASGALPYGATAESRGPGDPQEAGEETDKSEVLPAPGGGGGNSEPAPLLPPLDPQDANSLDGPPSSVGLTLTIGEAGETAGNFGIAKRRKFACSVCGHSPDAEPSSISPPSTFPPAGSEAGATAARQQQQGGREGQATAGELEGAFRDVFAQYDSGRAHAHYKCRRAGCERVRPDGRRGDKFVHKWLSDRELTYCERTGVYWLLYEEGQGMFCYLCRRHDTHNKQNKTKVFNGTPAVRYKKSALQVHAESQQHAAAVHGELAGRLSERELAEAEEEQGAGLPTLFLAAYWLARQELPASRLRAVLRLLAQAGLRGLGDAAGFRRPETLCQVFAALGRVIGRRLARRVRQAGCFGLLCDRVAGPCATGGGGEGPTVLAYVQYVDPATAEVLSDFLFAEAAAATDGGGSAEELAGLIGRGVRRLELPARRLASLVTDGGELMAGGVVGRLRELSPALLAVHCLCPRLPLAGAWAWAPASLGPACHDLLRLEAYLQQLWELLERSAGLAEAYLAARLEAAPPPPRLRGALLRRLRRACRRRRLSFEASAEGAYNDYPALLAALAARREAEAAAGGLLDRLRTPRFAGALYILREVAPVLSGLAKAFRPGAVNFSTLEPSLKYAVYKLNEAAGSRQALGRLQADLQPGGRLAGASLPPPGPEQEAELAALLEAYVAALKADLQRRFGGSLALLSAFSVFNPLLVPCPEAPDFADYGRPEMRALAAHFHPQAEAREAQLLAEWERLKPELHGWKEGVPDSVLSDGGLTVTEWCLKRLLALGGEARRSYAGLLPLAEVSLAMPLTDAWPERGLGALRRVEAQLRAGRCSSSSSSGDTELLNSLMHISVNGPDFGTPDCAQVVQEAALLFRQRRAAAERPAPEDEPGFSEAPDGGLQTEQELEQLQQEVDEAVGTLQLQADHESDSDDSICD